MTQANGMLRIEISNYINRDNDTCVYGHNWEIVWDETEAYANACTEHAQHYVHVSGLYGERKLCTKHTNAITQDVLAQNEKML